MAIIWLKRFVRGLVCWFNQPILDEIAALRSELKTLHSTVGYVHFSVDEVHGEQVKLQQAVAPPIRKLGG